MVERSFIWLKGALYGIKELYMVERSFIWLKGALYGLKTKILKNALAHSLLERKARISTRESKLNVTQRS